jgi:agmatine/peptidylarginine deiminase
MPFIRQLLHLAGLFSLSLYTFCSADEGQYRITLDKFGGMNALRFDATEYPRLVAEFEPTRALLLSVSDWQPQHRHIFVEIAEKTKGHVHVIVLCNNTHQIKMATGWLLERGQSYPHIYFCEMELDTVWIRDFGPVFAQTNQGTQVLDFLYEGTRPKDDALPALWAKNARCKRVEVPWTMQGGNLMSNGQGTALMTHRVFRDNYVRFPQSNVKMNVEHERRIMVIKAMMQGCNLSQLVILEPLHSEITSHVDMFATFVSPGDVMLAQVDPRLDPINSQILERNASRLKQVQIGNAALRVHRVPIPPRQGKSWSAYTNAIVVGDLILLPTFKNDAPQVTEAARSVYARLMPESTIKTIDMTTMQQLQGELHCLSLHIPMFAPMPEPVYSFAGAKQTYFPQEK